MNLSRQEMVEVAEDLLAIVEADMVPLLSARRLERLRSVPSRPDSPPWEVAVAADQVARLASKMIAGSPAQWKDAAFAALGCRQREEVVIDVLREVAERARKVHEVQDPRIGQSDEPLPARATKQATIHSTLGNRNRKRGNR